MMKTQLKWLLLVLVLCGWNSSSSLFAQETPLDSTQQEQQKRAAKKRRDKELAYFYPIYTLRSDFSKETGPIRQYVHRELGFTALVLKDKQVLKELKLDPKIESELQHNAKQAYESARKNFRFFYNTGDKSHFEEFYVDAKEFEQYVKRVLTKKNQKKLAQIKKNAMEVLKNPLNPLRRHFKKMSEKEISKLKQKLHPTCEKIAIKGNKLFIKNIKKIFPDYFQKASLEKELTNLPCLPLESFIALTDEKSQNSWKIRRLFNSYDLELMNDLWLFPYRPIEKTLTNEIVVYLWDFNVWRPELGWLKLKAKHFIAAKNKKKADQFIKLYTDLARRIYIDNEPNVDMDLEQQKLADWLEENLDKEEMLKAKSYAKLHSMFTLGPHCVRSRLKIEGVELRLSDEEFQRRLTTFKEKLQQFVERSESQLTKELRDITKSPDPKSPIIQSLNSTYDEFVPFVLQKKSRFRRRR